ncbi:BLUF domain-containing protein [Hymenobacter radiodurans]|uniref:BLUF domain-containing protein n=1 Tax=Hymenobacter radiodurans TaxID=2496028 RepID=UPI001058511B|nr:BLUF domain-containing protein [Hymenobacter radiodurans]
MNLQAVALDKVAFLSYLLFLSATLPWWQFFGVLGANMLYQLSYVSRAVTPLSYPELRTLVAQARAYNVAHDITGILFYGEGNFAQVLEGEQAAVERLFERIQHDARHYDVTVITRVARLQRTYPQWGMAGHRLAEAQFAELVKYLPEESNRQPLAARLEAFVVESERL